MHFTFDSAILLNYVDDRLIRKIYAHVQYEISGERTATKDSVDVYQLISANSANSMSEYAASAAVELGTSGSGCDSCIYTIRYDTIRCVLTDMAR